MRKEEKVRICDVCEKRISDGGETRNFGNSVFLGWFKLERVYNTGSEKDLQTQNEWDICSKECLQKLIEERLK